MAVGAVTERMVPVPNHVMVAYSTVIVRVQIQCQLMVEDAAMVKLQRQKHAIFKAALVKGFQKVNYRKNALSILAINLPV